MLLENQIARLKTIYSNLSKGDIDVINQYIDLIYCQNKKINLIGKTTFDNFFDRHIMDCFQLIGYIKKTTKNVLDFGSGSGLPGLLLAIVLKDKQFYLLEKSYLKSDFLYMVIDKLKLQNIIIINDNVNNKISFLKDIDAKLIISRAFKPIIDICKIAYKINGNEMLLLKGKKHKEEISIAEKDFDLQYDIHKSLVHSEGVVVEISKAF